MAKKFRILLIFISLSLCLCVMSNTYSRYIAGTTGDLEVYFAKWQILLNGTDITSNNSSISLTPQIIHSDYVADNKLAPSSEGYFDIEIDPSNVEVSYDYRIDLSYDTDNLPDLVVSEYAILDEDYVEGDSVTPISIANNTITGSFDYDNMTDNFSYSTFTVRIYFKWYEGEDESMNDAADTLIGSNAANDINTTFDVTANISFSQKLS